MSRDVILLATYLRCGSLKEAAYRQKMHLQTAKNMLRDLYARLGVHSAIEASIALGWTKVPDEVPADWPRCELPGHCTLPPHHRGAHRLAA